MSGEPATGQRRPRAVSYSPSWKEQAAKRGRGKRGPASKGRASCAVCRMTQCKLGCPGRENTGQDAVSEGCRAEGQGRGQVIKGRKQPLMLTVAGGVRGRRRGMQGPGDPGEKATPNARDVSSRTCRRRARQAGGADGEHFAGRARTSAATARRGAGC